MKSQSIVAGIVVVFFVVSLFSLSVNTNLANARVICVDKYNYTSVIPCSDQNAIEKSSVKSSHISASGGNITRVGDVYPDTYKNCLARYGQNLDNQHGNPVNICIQESDRPFINNTTMNAGGANTKVGSIANATTPNGVTYSECQNAYNQNPSNVTIDCLNLIHQNIKGAKVTGVTRSTNPAELNQIRNATFLKCSQSDTMKHCFQQELQLYGSTLTAGVRSLVQCETQHSMDYCLSNAGPVPGNNGRTLKHTTYH